MSDRLYPVALVGEQHYQPAIGRCIIGDRVVLFQETGNPHDDRAIVAVNLHGQTIGYIPQDSFVQGVVHDQGLACAATIKNIARGPRDFVEVVLEVGIVDASTGTLPFGR